MSITLNKIPVYKRVSMKASADWLIGEVPWDDNNIC